MNSTTIMTEFAERLRSNPDLTADHRLDILSDLATVLAKSLTEHEALLDEAMAVERKAFA